MVPAFDTLKATIPPLIFFSVVLYKMYINRSNVVYVCIVPNALPEEAYI